jgi:hypothetical protein
MAVYEIKFKLSVGSEFSVTPFLGDTNPKRYASSLPLGQTTKRLTWSQENTSYIQLFTRWKRTEFLMDYFKTLSVPRLHSVEEQDD